MLKNVKCKECLNSLLTSETTAEHPLIDWRNYSRKSLLKPNTSFTKLFGQCIAVAQHVLPVLCYRNNVKKT